MEKKNLLGIDIGGTKALFLKVNESGSSENRQLISTTKDFSLDTLIHEIAKWQPFNRIGIAIAGQISKDRQSVVFAPNLNWRNVSLVKLLSSHFQVPVSLINDVQAAAIAEWHSGSGMGSQSGCTLFWGTGIGGALIFEGKLWQGVSRLAGEIGHMVVQIKGRECACGQFGCLEAYAGGRSIMKRAAPMLTEEVIEKARSGDKKCYEIWQEALLAMDAALVSLIHAFNPEIFVFGGGIIEHHPYLVSELQKRVEKLVLPSARGSFRFVKSILGEDAAAFGAAISSSGGHVS